VRGGLCRCGVVGGKRLDRLAAHARDDEAGGEHRRHLDAEPDATRGGAAACTASDERCERGGERNQPEALEGGALGTLTAFERRAVLALA
jgi:hypothetical protein